MATKCMRNSRSRTRGSSNQSDEDESSGSDMDLEKELHPLGHYLNEREEMINQVFKVIKGPKLKAMLTSGLRDLDIKELKALCLTQLEGMSKKRIKTILAGRDMDESSATDESEADDDEEENEDEQGMAGSLGDIIKPSLLKKPSESPKQDEPIEIHDSSDDSGDKEAKDIQLENVEDEEEEEDLQEVIAKKTKDLIKKQSVDLNVGKKITSKKDITAGDETSAAEPVDNQKIMELLELEMRARAIKSLLSRTKKDDSNAEGKAEMVSSETAAKKEIFHDEDKVKLIKEVQDPEESKKQLMEQKKLHKAREALSVSMAKKRKEQEEVERQREEVKRRIEEQEAKKKAEEDAIRKQAEIEAEKAKKKAEKEAERQKYLEWKKAKEEKEMEAEMMANKEKEERTKINLKRKQEQLKESEEKQRLEREKLTKETEMKKRKINRENVDDELEHSYDISLEYEDFDEDHEASKDHDSKPRRRYRRKGEDEEGEIEGSPIEQRNSRSLSPSQRSSRSRSYSSRSGSETSLSLTDSEDDRKLEKLRQTRLERVNEIKERKRKRKRASDIEDGEVDSDGEHFAPDKGKSDSKKQRVVEKASEKAEESEKGVEKVESDVQHDDLKNNEMKGENDENIQKVEQEEMAETIENEEKFQQEEVDATCEKDKTEGDTMVEPEVAKQPEQVDPKESDEIVEPQEPVEDVANKQVQDEDSQPSVIDSHDSNSMQEEPHDSKEPEVSDDKPKKRAAKSSWRDRHLKRQHEQQQNQVEDYVFKTKRQIVLEEEHAPEIDPIEEQDESEERLQKKKEAKEREKKQKQIEMRLKRMQAFQARSGMQEETVAEEETDFYKSYYEEEERLKIEESENKSVEETEVEVKSTEPEVEKPTLKEITDKDLPKRDPNVVEKESVAYWSKMCESELKSKGPSSPKKKSVKASRGTKDLPSKAQVDAQQAEQQTWADRWYSNKKVKKVVQDSKMFSKVRTQFKTKVKPDDDSVKPPEEAPGTSAKDLKAEALRRKANRNPKNTELPVIGTMDEYAKLAAKKEEEAKQEELNESSEDEEEEEDSMWSAILG